VVCPRTGEQHRPPPGRHAPPRSAQERAAENSRPGTWVARLSGPSLSLTIGTTHQRRGEHIPKGSMPRARNQADPSSESRAYCLREKGPSPRGPLASGWLAAILGLTVGDPQLEGIIGPTPQPPAPPIAGSLTSTAPPTSCRLTRTCCPERSPLGRTTGRRPREQRSPLASLTADRRAHHRPADLAACANPGTTAPQAPTALIVHGSADPLVPAHQSQLL